MAITYVGAASAASNSVSLPTFQAGDVAFVMAEGTSKVSLPSGWVSLFGYGNSETGWRVLQAGDTSTGTWTNASHIGVVVYRGVDTRWPYDSKVSNAPTSGSGTSQTLLTDPALGSSSTRVHAVLITSAHTISSHSGTGWTNENGTGGIFGVADLPSGTWANSTFNFSGSAGYLKWGFAVRAATTFPFVADFDTTSGTVTSNSSSWTLTYPTNIAAGDLLLAMVAQDGGSGSPVYGTWPSGWVEGGTNQGAVACAFAKKSATGSETGTFTWGTIGGSGEQGSWIIYRIPAGTWSGDLGSHFGNQTGNQGVASYTSTGSSLNPDPLSLDPPDFGSGYTLWIAAMSADTSRTVSAYPSSPDTFTNTGSLVSGGSNGATLAWGRLEKNASSVDPGTFTISSSDDWAAVTIAIQPFVPASPTDDPRQVRVYRQVLAH